LIQSVPSNSTADKLTEWFSKTNTMLESFESDNSCFVVYDTFDQMNNDKTIDQMLRYLNKKHSRVTPTAIDTNSFTELCNKVDKEAKDITQFEYEQELIAM
jgi:hypothetical protein